MLAAMPLLSKKSHLQCFSVNTVVQIRNPLVSPITVEFFPDALPVPLHALACSISFSLIEL